MITLDQSQRAALDLVLRSRVAILTGGPGTGKTTVCHHLLAELSERDGLLPHEIALCSPTGKAAKRLAEQTHRPASTIHRLLGYDPSAGGFIHDATDRLPYRLILVDEASMIDAELGAALLCAVADGARVVFVGDVDQLPSVGPGRVLADVIDSGTIPTARLTQIHRVDERSWISRNARRVLEGKAPVIAEDSKDFFWTPCDDAEHVADEIERLCLAEPSTQVLAPQKSGACGVEALNKRLQAARLPPPKNAAECDETPAWRLSDDSEMREGDRVIHVKNDYKLGVMNGETGDVVRLDERMCRVDLGDRIVDYARGQAKNLRLAYALTIHKSQGSEYEHVAIPVHTSHSFMLSRSLLYTAITRGKKTVRLVGDDTGLQRAGRNKQAQRRQTGLRRLLEQAQ